MSLNTKKYMRGMAIKGYRDSRANGANATSHFTPSPVHPIAEQNSMLSYLEFSLQVICMS